MINLSQKIVSLFPRICAEADILEYIPPVEPEADLDEVLKEIIETPLEVWMSVPLLDSFPDKEPIRQNLTCHLDHLKAYVTGLSTASVDSLLLSLVFLSVLGTEAGDVHYLPKVYMLYWLTITERKEISKFYNQEMVQVEKVHKKVHYQIVNALTVFESPDRNLQGLLHSLSKHKLKLKFNGRSSYSIAFKADSELDYLVLELGNRVATSDRFLETSPLVDFPIEYIKVTSYIKPYDEVVRICQSRTRGQAFLLELLTGNEPYRELRQNLLTRKKEIYRLKQECLKEIEVLAASCFTDRSFISIRGEVEGCTLEREIGTTCYIEGKVEVPRDGFLLNDKIPITYAGRVRLDLMWQSRPMNFKVIAFSDLGLTYGESDYHYNPKDVYDAILANLQKYTYN